MFYLIVSIPDLCHISYFVLLIEVNIIMNKKSLNTFSTATAISSVKPYVEKCLIMKMFYRVCRIITVEQCKSNCN